MASAGECRPTKDFLRHIANRVISENIARLPLNVVDDIKKRLGQAEDKYRFSLYNGNPLRLVDYLRSEDFLELAKYLKALHVDWILDGILQALEEEYSESCRPVAEAAREARRTLKEEKVEVKERITVDGIARMFKMAGYKVERTEEGKIVVEEPNIKVTVWAEGDGVSYMICRTGRVTTFEALMAKISKIREI